MKKFKHIFIIAVYILSCVGAWHNYHKKYSEEWVSINPDGVTIVMIFMPGVNTLATLDYLLQMMDINANGFLQIPKRK